jgi:hypothetical protein
MSSSSFEPPKVRRRTVTLTHDKILKEVNAVGEVRIIRAAKVDPHARAVREASKTQSSAQRQLKTQGPNIIRGALPITSPDFTPNKANAQKLQSGATVLVINASQDTAEELTSELTRTLPGCSILFAPTLHLALWILKRRTIDLIVSSAVLPDGNISKLHEALEVMSPPPELVVISDLTSYRGDLGSHPGYRFVELRRVPAGGGSTDVSAGGNSGITKGHVVGTPGTDVSTLGADIRNDLNNPLQEIVAMAFVATTSDGLSPVAEEALNAIQRAASNMSSVVNSLEDKIRSVVMGVRVGR